MKNLLTTVGILGISSLLPFAALGQTKHNRDMPAKQKLVAPMPVYEAEPNNEHMKDHLFIHNDDSMRLAVLAKWRVELVNDSIDPSILVIKIIDTNMPMPPIYPMAQPMDSKQGGTVALDVRDNFCAACEMWLRPLSTGLVHTEVLPKKVRFLTNSPKAELFLDDDRYTWPGKEKLSANFTFEVHEQNL